MDHDPIKKEEVPDKFSMVIEENQCEEPPNPSLCFPQFEPNLSFPYVSNFSQFIPFMIFY